MKRLNASSLFALCAALGLLSCGRGHIKPGLALANASPCHANTKTCSEPEKALDPFFVCRLAPISYADDIELCRRAFVDTIGRLPTGDEYTSTCKGKNIDQMLSQLMAKPEYLTTRQRFWAERLGYNDTRTSYKNIIDMDSLVGQLYGGQLSFSDFITKAAIHPALLSRGEGDGRVQAVFEGLVGRSPSVDEYLNFGSLYHPYVTVDDYDSAINFNVRRVMVNACACAGANQPLCQATFTFSSGTTLSEDVSLPLRFPEAANCAGDAGNIFFIEDATSDEIAILQAPGQVLLKLDDFYYSNAASVVAALIGYDVTALLPNFTQALGDELQSTNDVRQLEKAIFESELYTQSQMPATADIGCDGNEQRYLSGPLRRLSGEAYLDSITALTGHAFGACDYRLQLQTRRTPPPPLTAADYVPGANIHHYPMNADGTPDFTYRDDARALGGCPRESPAAQGR